MTVQLYNTKDHAIIIKKGTAVAQMVATNGVPEMVLLEHSKLEDGPGKVMSSSQLRREESFSVSSERSPKPMLDVGAIKPSKSACSNAMVLVWKKDGGRRFCIDFQRLNS